MPPPLRRVVPAPASRAEPGLPIQAPVEEPIINSPFRKPRWHWVYERSGRANKLTGRRRASYFWTMQRTGSAQQTFEGIASDYGSDDLPLVNALREAAIPPAGRTRSFSGCGTTSHHEQTTFFGIALLTVNWLTESQPGREAKLRYAARHQLFPQVLRIVEEYAERRVTWNGCHCGIETG